MLSRVSHRYAAIATVLLLAFALRVHGLTAESLWIDEGYSMALADRGVMDIVRGTIADQHPPLYYVLLHLWRFVGDSVYHTRYLSVLLGILGLAVAFTTARALLGVKVGLIALFWAAISPMHVWYSQEARMYILLALLTTLSVYTFWRLVSGDRGWVGYAVVTALALYTHNYAVFVVAVECILAAVWVLLRWQSPRSLSRWGLGLIAVAGAYALWVPVVLYQARAHQMRWLASPNLATLRGTLNWLLLGQVTVRPPDAVWPLLLILVSVLLFAASSRQRRGLTVALGWLLLPIGGAFAVSQLYPIFQSKQFLIVLPALTTTMAAALSGLRRWPRLLMVGVLLAYNVSGLLTDSATRTKHEWREIAGYISTRWADGDVLYLNPAASMLVLDVYLPDATPYAGYPPGYDVVRGGWAGTVVEAATPELVLAPLVANHRRIWLVEFSPGFWDPQAYLAQWLLGHADIADVQTFSGISVRLFNVHR